MKKQIAAPTLALMACMLAGPSAHATTQDNYDLEYNTFTGEVTLVTTGPIVSYRIESSSPTFLSDNHFDRLRTLFDIGNGMIFPVKIGIKDSTPMRIAELEPDSDTGAGRHNIGDILPAGLSASQWLDIPDIGASYETTQGQPPQPFDLTYVPEPTSLACVAVAGLMLRRRRHE